MEKEIDYSNDLIVLGMLFCKYLNEGLLKERNHPSNAIDLNILKDDGTFLNGSLNAYHGIKTFQSPMYPLEKVNLPTISLYREFVYNTSVPSDERIREVNAESIAEQRGFQAIDSLTNSRLNNQLPEMELMGKTYRLNLVKDHLQDIANPRRKIVVTGFSPRGPLGEYTFLHVPGSELFIAMNSRTLKIPDGACVVVMDNMLRVDPIGTALKFFLPPTSLLCKFMMMPNPHFKVYALNDTDIPDQVRRNQLEQENHETGSVAVRRHKTMKRPENNKGIRS